MLGRQINGEMVQLARKRRRRTQSELAKLVGLPQTTISRIENGTPSDLTPDQVRALAAVLGFPVSFFFDQDPVYRKPISLHAAAFRKRASVSVKNVDAVVALGNHYILQLRRLFDSVEISTEFELPQFEVVSSRNAAGEHARAVSSASEAASAVRAAWQLDDGPIPSLTRYVEATGVAVIHADFEGADIDGFTLRPVGLRPVIFLNRDRPADRKRFSLAHEFGHVVLHPFPYEEMEKEANEFAAELLMPKSGVLPDLRKGLSLPALGRLKIKWQVSIASLIYRAKVLGVVTQDMWTKLWIELGPYRVREPEAFDFPPETTKLVGDVVRAHLEDLHYPVSDLASAVATTPEEFAVMHGLDAPEAKRSQKPKLRLISST